jgi:peptidoglycan/LPS O-acetylase OafA/YrhL
VNQGAPCALIYDREVTALPEPDAGRIPELDGIRGLAIFLVLIWHFVLCEIGAPPPLFRFMSLTWSGVTLFFVLSGFLIGGILLDHRGAPNYFAAFYGRRVCRIFPIYYLWLLLFVAAPLLLRAMPIGSATAWLMAPRLPLWSYATFTQNFVQARHDTLGANWMAITWSLAVEEQFYLLLPLVIRFTPARWLPYVLGAGILAAPISRAMLYDPHDVAGIPTVVLLVTKIDALFLGVLCAYVARLDGARERIARMAPGLRIAFFSALGFLILDSYSQDGLARRIRSDSLLAVMYAALLMLAVFVPASPFGRMARWAWLRALGMIAYGTYLIHETVAGLVFGVARGHWPYVERLSELWLNVAALAITIALAAASWRWFEKPIVRFGRRRWVYSR